MASPTADRSSDGLPASMGGRLRSLRVSAWALVATTLVQAGLAGPAWFTAADLFELHGWIGSGILLLAALVTALTFLSRQVWGLRIAALAITAGCVAQIGLGYAGRRSGIAAASAIHIPLGVTLLGLAVALAVLVTVTPPGGRPTPRS